MGPPWYIVVIKAILNNDFVPDIVCVWEGSGLGGVCVFSFVLGFIAAMYFLGLITSLWALMEVAQLGNSVLPSEQEDQIPVFLVLLSHLVVVGGRPVAWDTLQFWACCLPDLPECGRAQERHCL